MHIIKPGRASPPQRLLTSPRRLYPWQLGPGPAATHLFPPNQTPPQALRKQHGFDAIAVMPTNLYGPGDNFHPTNSHVMPALIRRFVEAKTAGVKQVTCWGTGSVYREFLHVDDLAAACLHLMNVYSDSGIVNIGTGTDVTIRELTEMVQRAVGWEGEVLWDSSKPDGTPRKLLDVSKLKALGWTAGMPLQRGVQETVDWFVANQKSIDLRL